MNGPGRARLLIACAVLLGASAVAAWRSGHLGGLRTAEPVVVSAAPTRIVADTLHRGETVSQLFARQGVNDV
ncbi:MAG TPA: hypothetical protein VGI92_13830, partial [Gemmatimonadales bacterium]